MTVYNSPTNESYLTQMRVWGESVDVACCRQSSCSVVREVTSVIKSKATNSRLQTTNQERVEAKSDIFSSELSTTHHYTLPVSTIKFNFEALQYLSLIEQKVII